MSSVAYLPEARADLRGIWQYIVNASQSIDVADRLLRSLDAACVLHATQPFAGQLRSELAADVRSFSVGKYVVFYLPDSNGIEVMQIIHGSRDITSAFRGLPEK